MFAFAHLYNVQRGTPAGAWSADWKLKTGDGLHLRLTVASADGAEVNLCDGSSPAGGALRDEVDHAPQPGRRPGARPRCSA